jgi:hypothetical protein
MAVVIDDDPEELIVIEVEQHDGLPLTGE